MDIYKVLVGENDGIVNVSFVECPATEVDFLCFSNDKVESMEFSIDETKHRITAPLMLANTPIYRRNDDYEYYVVFDADTLTSMCEKMLRENKFNNIDADHKYKLFDDGKVNMLEIYQKSESNIGPFPNIPDGSIICTYQINDDAIWEECTNGRWNGISLAGDFTLQLIDKNFNENFEKNKKKKNCRNNMDKFFKNLMKVMGFSSVTTEKGILNYVGESIEVGSKIILDDGSIPEDGKYFIVEKDEEDKDVVSEEYYITINDGLVEDVVLPNVKEDEKPETEDDVEMTEDEETKEDEKPETEDETKDDTDVDALNEKIAELENENKALNDKIKELEEKTKKNDEKFQKIEDAYNKMVKDTDIRQKYAKMEGKMNNISSILSNLK